MTLKSVWLKNKYEHKLISAQCILTGKQGCRRFESMAKRIVNFISDARTILLFPYSYGYTGNIFLATATDIVERLLRTKLQFGRTPIHSGRTNLINLNPTWLGQNVRRFSRHGGQFHEWVGQCP